MFNQFFRAISQLFILAVLIVFVCSRISHAAESSDDKGWHFMMTPYVGDPDQLKVAPKHGRDTTSQ